MSGAVFQKPRVGLFVTCLVDLIRPAVGFAAVKLMERARCEVVVPAGQTCCGQPAYNAGDNQLAAALARQTIAALEGYDYVVAPSGSCAGMLKRHYPSLLAQDAAWAGRALAFAERVHELTSFLVDVRGLEATGSSHTVTATVHDSCAALRELGISSQPRKLLSGVEGLSIREMPESEVCCGFGGMFATKYDEISAAIGDKKCRNIEVSGAELVVACDLGCLLHIAGLLKRQNATVSVRHIAEVLAGDAVTPAIGEA